MINIFKETHTQKNQEQYYSPSNEYPVLRKENEDLLNGKQQDAHEFLSRIMKALENKKNCSTMFAELFEHVHVTIVKCEYCHKTSSTTSKYSGHVIEVHGRLTVREAVESYFAEEIVETYYCELCQNINKNSARKSYLLESGPKILYLVLNRFRNERKKNQDNIELNEELQLSVASETNQINYKLASIINHYGTSRFKGHYTATACCSNSYYEFDDSRVHDIKDPIGCNAYILMYELTEVFLQFLLLLSESGPVSI